MAGEVEAAGDIATGALWARTVERADDPHGDGAGGLCLNCGTRRSGPFCHHCGQSAHVHRTLGSIGHDLLHGVFHFEGKIWRTLPMLAFRPGELTRRYVAGERARFVSPLALFLFSVFLMFAVLNSIPSFALVNGDNLFSGRGTEQARRALDKERVVAGADVADKRRELSAELADREPDPARIKRLRARIDDAVAGQAAIERARRVLATDREAATQKPENWFDRQWQHARENPQLLLYKVKSSAYKYSWALIPLSLPFIWLLFPLRRDVGLYDHAVFATYSLTFMSLLAILLAVLQASHAPEDVTQAAWLVIAPLHMYKQLKGGYRLTRAGALWRTVWLLAFAFVCLVVFVGGLFLLGLTG